MEKNFKQRFLALYFESFCYGSMVKNPDPMTTVEIVPMKINEGNVYFVVHFSSYGEISRNGCSIALKKEDIQDMDSYKNDHNNLRWFDGIEELCKMCNFAEMHNSIVKVNYYEDNGERYYSFSVLPSGKECDQYLIKDEKVTLDWQRDILDRGIKTYQEMNSNFIGKKARGLIINGKNLDELNAHELGLLCVELAGEINKQRLQIATLKDLLNESNGIIRKMGEIEENLTIED